MTKRELKSMLTKIVNHYDKECSKPLSKKWTEYHWRDACMMFQKFHNLLEEIK